MQLYGTYLIIVDAEEGLRFYAGLAYVQTIADRHATHQQKLEAVRRVRDNYNIVGMELATEEMELLYGPGVRERESDGWRPMHSSRLAC